MKINDALANIQPLGISIRKMDFTNNFVVFKDDDGVTKQLDVRYNIDEMTCEDEENALMGTLSLFVDITIKNDKEEQMDIHLHLQGGFISNKVECKEVNIENFKNMLEVNGCAALYSIARSIIISLTSQACVGDTIILPMINIFKMKE
ncbi:MAG: hypothetical protein K0S18_1881 [Anaerocolumna sp.]|jgi:preprotein translocase subunit SecB|nr:hypothetical protein [Anaerocolumna sp.]